jgi:hypothetical protein
MACVRGCGDKKIAVGFLVRRYSNAVSVRRMFDQFGSQETVFNAS